ncbi:RNA polymerase sigma factor SigF [Streptomyces sp. TRM70308]|uniref:RNA polymerase sigma factor SigF n=1 Tax=Streptomyces sp. TRM70308 TaxID=3131932 RepID=UPI003D03A33C
MYTATKNEATTIEESAPAVEASDTAIAEPAAEPLPHVADPSAVSPGDARELSKHFFVRLQELEEGTHEYQYVRNTLIELNLSLVRFAAGRFRSRGDSMEDIVQVGTIGLIKAIDRFDLERGVEFPTFAVPYIVGEIKRFFRDTSWAVHVPRRLQELRIDLARATDKLSTALHRAPTPQELAEELGLGVDEVIEGIIASNGYAAGSLDTPAAEGDSGAQQSIAERVGDEDPALEAVENLHTLAPLLEQLDERERTLVNLRFGAEMTQAEIGAELGISQMHVSRLLSRMLAKLRRQMLA